MHKYFQKWLNMDMEGKKPEYLLMTLRLLVDQKFIKSYPAPSEMQGIVKNAGATNSLIDRVCIDIEKEYPETKELRKITQEEAWLIAVKTLRDFKRDKRFQASQTRLSPRPAPEAPHAPAPSSPPRPRPDLLVRFKIPPHLHGKKKHVDGTKAVIPPLSRYRTGLVNRSTWRLADPSPVPHQRLKEALGPDYTFKVISGFSFLDWARSGTALDHLSFLGAGRLQKIVVNANSSKSKSLSPSKSSGSAPRANRPPGICDGTLEDLEQWFHKIGDAHRYAVLVSTVKDMKDMKGNVSAPAGSVVSAMFCTVNGTRDVVTDVIVDFICTVQGHGVPLMTFAEYDARERGARYIKLASVMDQVGFYQKKLKYVRSRNECKEPLKEAEIESAARAWTREVKRLKDELLKFVGRPGKPGGIQRAKKSLETAKTPDLIQSRTDKLKLLMKDAKATKLRLSRLQQADVWRGLKWTGRGVGKNAIYEPMYKEPVYFESNSHEKKYHLPVFSKCLQQAQRPKTNPKPKSRRGKKLESLLRSSRS